MAKSILVSVVVCTFNRADFLDKCLESLLKQVDSPSFEIVVVDNNSTDRTAHVAQEASAQKDIPLQYVFLKEMGLSRARNTGVQAARGEIVAFIDDDAVAEVDWVNKIEKGFQLFPQAVAEGGAVKGDYEIPKPDWLPIDLLFSISVGDLGSQPRLMNASESMVGCNMAFRRQLFQQRGLFATSLGRTGLSLLAGEEVEFCNRLHDHGDPILYNPEMVIKHRVPKERLTKEYIRKRMYWNGRSIARADVEHGNSIWVRACARLVGAIPLAALKEVLAFGKQDRRFFYGCMIAKHWGYINEVLELSRRSAGKAATEHV